MNKLEKTRSKPINFLNIEIDTPFVKLEKGLIGIGYFSVPKYREGKRNPLQEKIVKILNLTEHGIEGKAEILTHRRYGLPTISDLTKYLAFLKIVHEKYKHNHLISNPIEFTHFELLQKANIKRNINRYQEVTEWIQRLHNTQIMLHGELENPKYNKDSGIHLFEKFKISGTIDENGEEVKQNQIWLSEWAIKNICELPLVPIDFETYQKLKNDTAKLLVAHLQVWLYGSKNSHIFQKTYAEFAQLLGIKEWQRKGKIIEQLENAFQELQQHEYISNWKIADAATGYKIMLWHGRKFHRDLDRARAFLIVKQPPSDLPLHLPTDEPKTNTELSGEQKNIFDYLVNFGMFDELAQKLVDNFDAKLLKRRTAWAVKILRDVEKREKVVNKGGFLHKIINSNDAVPDDFQTPEEINVNANIKLELVQKETLEALKEDWLANRYAEFCLEEGQKTPRLPFERFKQTFEEKRGSWENVLHFIEKNLSPEIFSAWFAQLTFAGCDDCEERVFLLAAPVTEKWITSYHAELLESALKESGFAEYEIRWLIGDSRAASAGDESSRAKKCYERVLITDYRDGIEAVSFEDFYAANSKYLEKRFADEYEKPQSGARDFR